MADSIPTYVISLNDSAVRRRNMVERLGRIGIPFEFVDAVDGRTTRLPDVFDGARVLREYFWGESALACAMSHRKVHRTIAESESDLTLVFEDDAELVSDFAQVVNAAKHFKCDLFKLEGGPLRRYVRVGTVRDRYSVVVGMVPSLGSAGYLITRRAAQRFCALQVLDQMPDEAFGDPRLNLKVLELHPRAVMQDQETPTMVNLQSYGIRPAQLRRSTYSRLLNSVRKRTRLLTAYGLTIAFRLELQRLVRRGSR